MYCQGTAKVQTYRTRVLCYLSNMEAESRAAGKLSSHQPN